MNPKDNGDYLKEFTLFKIVYKFVGPSCLVYTKYVAANSMEGPMSMIKADEDRSLVFVEVKETSRKVWA